MKISAHEPLLNIRLITLRPTAQASLYVSLPPIVSTHPPTGLKYTCTARYIFRDCYVLLAGFSAPFSVVSKPQLLWWLSLNRGAVTSASQALVKAHSIQTIR